MRDINRRLIEEVVVAARRLLSRDILITFNRLEVKER